MQLDIDYFKVKIIADSLGYLSGFLSGYFSYKYYFKKHLVSIPFRNLEEKLFYYLGILAGAMFFAGFVSTLDRYLLNGFPDGIILSKTVAGAIAGGVISSEIIKKIYKHDFNRGVLFVPSLIIGIIVGRIGAFLIGLRDNTHGLETTLPWGYDYGDGILRHPSQIYEIIVLLSILIIFLIGINYKRDWWITNGFFILTLIYFTYRFLVGFVMPYSDFWFGMNTIQVVSIGMIVYSVYKLRKYSYGKKVLNIFKKILIFILSIIVIIGAFMFLCGGFFLAFDSYFEEIGKYYFIGGFLIMIIVNLYIIRIKNSLTK